MKKIFIILTLLCMLILIDNLNGKTNEVSNIIDNKYQNLETSIYINNRLVALTFDDGPSSKTKELVDLLNSYNIKATFFLLGERIKFYESEVIYIKKHNHELGNHSYSHPDFKKININEAKIEIEKTSKIIYELTSVYPKSFRFPYGSINREFLDYIELPIVLWNVDSLDWKIPNDNNVIRNVLKNLSNESVILFHDTNNYTKNAIIFVIEFLLENDYRFVTVSELFDFKNKDNTINGKVYY